MDAESGAELVVRATRRTETVVARMEGGRETTEGSSGRGGEKRVSRAAAGAAGNGDVVVTLR
jgi:hypothetical protein